MDDKNNTKVKENKAQTALERDLKSQKDDSGIYLRDDHCDWGSSGMNEFTNEFGGDK